MDDGYWGFLGAFRRALELPDGRSEGVSPASRARLRYNGLTGLLEGSLDGDPYLPLATQQYVTVTVPYGREQLLHQS